MAWLDLCDYCKIAKGRKCVDCHLAMRKTAWEIARIRNEIKFYSAEQKVID